MRLAVLIAVLALPAAAVADSVASDVTVGRGYVGASLIGDIEVRPSETYLIVAYSGVRPGPETALSHQFSLGADHAFSLHWLGSANLVWSPRSVNRIALGPDTVFRASNASLGGSATAAYQSAGFDFFEYLADVSLSATSYQLVRQFDGAVQSRLQRETLNVLRPAASFTALFDLWTELSVRGGVSLYSDDPITAGRFTDEQLQRIQSLFRPGPGQALLLQQSLLFADAVSGLQSAPVWFELRAQLGRRFTESLRAQLSYGFIRYVPTQGAAHVPSLRVVWSANQTLDLVGAVALQVDAPENDARTSTSLITVGLQVRFGEAADTVVADEDAD